VSVSKRYFTVVKETFVAFDFAKQLCYC